MRCFLFVVGSLVTTIIAAPAVNSFVVHEKRDVSNTQWSPSDIKLDPKSTFPLSIGLTQQNLDKSHDYLMDVSDPTSPNYSNHWTAQQVADAFRPTEETIDAVKSWLADHGISNNRISLSKGHTWIRFNVTVEEAESLLKTHYKVYEHAGSKKPYLACDEYSIPATLKAHIDFITPTTQFDAVVTESRKQRRGAGPPKPAPKPDGKVRPKPGPPAIHVHKGSDLTTPVPNFTQNKGITYSLANCNQYITPDCLRALYGIPVGTLSSSRASMGVIEFTPQAYRQADLDLFYKTLTPSIKAGTKPTLKSVAGGIVQNTWSDFNYNAESDLDLEYAIALVYPLKVTLFQVGDLYAGGSFGTFLDAIDATYCEADGGRDPRIDPYYPDPFPGGYKQRDCGKFEATSVISISYSYNEPDLSEAYAKRQCNEYLKLGLQGITVLVASGDYGVAGNTNQCCTYVGCANGEYNPAGTGGAFNPSFPSTCPYVTSVGATQIKTGAAVTAPETACDRVIRSGGGFSNVFPAPSYQTAALKTYFTRHKPNIPSGYYNTSAVRGYPDISVNGANYVVGVGGVITSVFGTSASTPVMGAIITLINQERIKARKKVVGLINPVLYANKAALNDITSGSNPGCQLAGFSAVTAWDPVTGLGTPNYPKLLSVFMALP